MSKGAHDILTLVINLLGLIICQNIPTLEFFEAINTIGQTLAKHLIELLN
jgi:hypothetical protein